LEVGGLGPQAEAVDHAWSVLSKGLSMDMMTEQ
jgi:hypothetical protein